MRLDFISTCCAAVLMVLGTASVVRADAATHELTVTTTDFAETDCGGGSCVPACKVEGSLTATSTGPEETRPLAVQLWYKSDHSESGEGAVSLQFEQFAKGSTVSGEDWASGHACKELAISRISIECFDESGGKCPGFYNVKFPDVPLIGLKAGKVEGK